ncbi:MAG: hypothetical protein H0U03_13440 [Actinobacteria bacterium]|nr:hypothetical protein [Actinomycetota bacterium]
MNASRLDRRQFVLRSALGAAGLYSLIDSFTAAPARAALAPKTLIRPREQHLLRNLEVIRRNGVEVIVPPLHHQVVTAKLLVEAKAKPLLAARTELERALQRLDRRFQPTPQGLGVAAAWGDSYFRRFVPRLANGVEFPDYLPVDDQSSRLSGQRTPVLQRSPRFRSDDETLVLEENDVALLFRSDSLDHIAAGAEAIFGALGGLFEITSIRKGFVGGGFDGGPGLPKQMALAAGIAGAELIPDGSQLFLGFTSTQRSAIAMDRITNFETLVGVTDQWPNGYFRGGTIMHLSHLFEDVHRWWTTFSFDEQARSMARPGVSLREGMFTLPDDASQLRSERELRDDAKRFGAVGHSGALHHVSRLDRNVVDNYGAVRKRGASFIQRADFNTLDNPFFQSARPEADGQLAEPAAGLHFIAFAPTAGLFHRMRWAMDGVLSGKSELGIEPRSREQGFNSVLRATHRQNFLVPPRAHRSFPLAERLRTSA